MNNIKPITALGIISSTSYDGISLATVTSDGVDIRQLGTAYIAPLDEHIMEAIRSIDGRRATDSPDTANKIRQVEILFTQFCAQLAKSYLAETDQPIDVIGFAGHTICHRPLEKYTHQIGDGAMLADLCQIKTVSRFRNADILNGGQGAPFTPIYYQALTAKYPRPLAVIDIGGTASISWFGHNGEMIAFVAGPGNSVINDWVMRHGAMHMDYNGRLAILGKVHEPILANLMKHKYFTQTPPKACDRSMFNDKIEHLEGLSLEDGAATATAFVAEAIKQSILSFLPELPQEIYICGGGAKNPTLMRFIRQRLPDITIKTTAENGWNSDVIDAQAAAFWAIRRLNLLPISYPFTTGVAVPCICGEIFEP